MNQTHRIGREKKENRHRHWLRLLFRMEKRTFEDSPAEEHRHFYRCLACGEMVDNRDLNEIVLHHAHVLHPSRFVFPDARVTNELTASQDFSDRK